MKQLKSGQHFGANKCAVRLEGCILTEAGYTRCMKVPWHYHENAYFFYHLRGRLEEVNKKKTVTCTTGTLLFHNWQDPHYDTNFSEDANFFHVEIENEWFLRHHFKSSVLEGSIELGLPLLKPIFRKIHQELRLNDNVSQISVDGLLLQAFAEITRTLDRKKSVIPGWVKKVRDILHDGTQDKMTLQMLSSETGIHPVHLSKEFPEYFGAGFGQYIRNLRIERAIELLHSKALTLSEIAFACGYSDQSHFIRCFKESLGMTPSKYRALLNQD